MHLWANATKVFSVVMCVSISFFSSWSQLYIKRLIFLLGILIMYLFICNLLYCNVFNVCCRSVGANPFLSFLFWRTGHGLLVKTLGITMIGRMCLRFWGLRSKLGSESWSNSLRVGIYLAISTPRFSLSYNLHLFFKLLVTFYYILISLSYQK